MLVRDPSKCTVRYDDNNNNNNNNMHSDPSLTGGAVWMVCCIRQRDSGIWNEAWLGQSRAHPRSSHLHPARPGRADTAPAPLWPALQRPDLEEATGPGSGQGDLRERSASGADGQGQGQGQRGENFRQEGWLRRPGEGNSLGRTFFFFFFFSLLLSLKTFFFFFFFF